MLTLGFIGAWAVPSVLGITLGNTINVNSLADVAANDGVCTLHEAITAANTNTASGAAAGECAAGSVTGRDSIEILVDGDFIGVAQYGFARPDVQQANPFLANAINSGWRFTMDTTKLSNARHRLTVRALDTGGLRTEIGSVDFYVQNITAIP